MLKNRILKNSETLAKISAWKNAKFWIKMSRYSHSSIFFEKNIRFIDILIYSFKTISNHIGAVMQRSNKMLQPAFVIFDQYKNIS